MGAFSSKQSAKRKRNKEKENEEAKKKQEDQRKAFEESERQAKLTVMRLRAKWQEQKLHTEIQDRQAAKDEQLGYAASLAQNLPIPSMFQQSLLLQQSTVAEPNAPPLTVSKPRRKRSKSKTRKPVKPIKNTQVFESNVCWPERMIVDYIVESHNVSRTLAENLTKLFQESNTMPFIFHYKQDMIMGMYLDDLKNIKISYETVTAIKNKANDYIRKFEGQGTLTPEIRAYLQTAKSLEDFPLVKFAFEGTLRNLAQKALNHGLGIVADAVLTGANIQPLDSFVKNDVNELKSEKAVKDRIIYILADKMSKNVSILEEIKKWRKLYPVNITCRFHENYIKNKRSNITESGKKKNWEAYEKFSCCIKALSPHEIMEINRCQIQKILYVRIEIPSEFASAFREYCKKKYGAFCYVSPLHQQLFTDAVDHLWEKSLKGFIANQTRNELTEKAQIALVDDFAQGIKNLFLTPPVSDNLVIGMEPGIHDGCKLVVLTKDHRVLETKIIFPFSDDPAATYEAERSLVKMSFDHRCAIVALGNSSARRKVECFLSDLIKKHSFWTGKFGYCSVEMYGITKCKQHASKQFPALDAVFLPAVCIAKRLLDPMEEWVQIDTKYLCQFKQQYNLPENLLLQKVNEVMTEAVSSVGVNINTASQSLLERVAGLDDMKARNIIAWRETSGPFMRRSDLRKVSGIAEKSYQQCVGFVRVFPDSVITENLQLGENSFDYFDQTSIHPSMYPIAEAFLKKINFRSSEIGMKTFTFAVAIAAGQLKELANDLNCNIEILRFIINALSVQKGHDVRGTLNEAMIRTSIVTWENLSPGSVLNGIVRGTSYLGAFVDIGAEIEGFLHKVNMQSILGSKKLHIGQCIQTKVIHFDKERSRISLALIKCF